MSHVSHTNESCLTYEWVMSHIRMFHIRILLFKVVFCMIIIYDHEFLPGEGCWQRTWWGFHRGDPWPFRRGVTRSAVGWRLIGAPLCRLHVLCVWTWLIYIYYCTHSVLLRDKCVSESSSCALCVDMTRWYVRHGPIICGTWLTYMWDMTHVYVTHICVIGQVYLYIYRYI